MQIAGIKKISLTDFPKRLSCVVYLAGCNFACPWCFTPELVALQSKSFSISEKDFLKFLKANKSHLSACVVTGGEPTIHPQLPLFLSKIKKTDYLIKLNTNGSNPKMLKELIDSKLVDYVEMDVKAPKEKYGQLVGFNDVVAGYFLNKIEKSIELLNQNKVDCGFCTTLTPLLSKQDILEIVKWIKPAKRYSLHNFDNSKTLDPNFSVLEPHSQEYLYRIQQAIAPFFEECRVK